MKLSIFIILQDSFVKNVRQKNKSKNKETHKKTLTRWKQKKNKKWPYERNQKTKKQQTSVNAMEGNQKTKNKFDHMEVFDKVLDTSYPQKAPLLNKPIIKYIYFTPFIHQTISI